ncbi:glycosyltransferase family 4 protein [Variovorax terrae]|uniref:Glycosyltransferase family 4 protein n=1 Tax=Variovorax terrae TaxID=2923278 RepID=A0A9X2ANF9_9BURK|nr:glycosyltransferase family 4 protein [Variovorax terrae]MCJ0764329.1 glycosyltransferase family 4 protein [Variovorax terrae]
MRIALFANTDWYLYNFRRSLAQSLKDAGYDVILISPAGLYSEKLKAMGFRWISAPMARRSLNPFKELLLIFWLWRLIKNENFDLIHGFTIKCAVYCSLAGRAAGISARVSAVAGLGYVFTNNGIQAKVLRPFVRLLMKFALGGQGSRLILQNPDDVSIFKKSSIIDQSYIRLILGSGVDCSRFSDFRPHVRSGPTRVLLAARILWDKGVSEYVAVAESLKKKNFPIQFLLAGAPDLGNPAAVSAEIIEKWMKNQTVEWLGHVEDMPLLLSSVDLMVLPSYREGLPKTLIEAAACGIPLITTDVPGCRDVVTHEVTGLLVPARDIGALESAIVRLVENPVLATELGRAAKEKALQEFDEKIIIKQTLAVYQELIPEA